MSRFTADYDHNIYGYVYEKKLMRCVSTEVRIKCVEVGALETKTGASAKQKKYSHDFGIILFFPVQNAIFFVCVWYRKRSKPVVC